MNIMKDKKLVYMTTRISLDEQEKIRMYAEKIDRPVSWLIREAINEYINNHQQPIASHRQHG